jgi:hypothetical protein
LIQGVGLSAEALVELLCHRDVEGALKLSREAHALAEVGTSIPGAAASNRYHRTCIAVEEALLGTESPGSVSVLEESAAMGRLTPLQLLGSFGLAAAMDRTGDAERAEALRAFIRQTAPHCAPLHLEAADFSISPRGQLSTKAGPVSSSIVRTGAAAAGGGRHKASRTLSKAVGAWLLLIVLFLTIRFFLTPSK